MANLTHGRSSLINIRMSSCLCLSLLSGYSLVWLLVVGLLVPAQRHTTDVGAWLHFGCTAADHAAHWANNLGQSHQALLLEATLGAHTLNTPLDLTRGCM